MKLTASVFQPYSRRGTFETLLSILRNLDTQNIANIRILTEPWWKNIALSQAWATSSQRSTCGPRTFFKADKTLKMPLKMLLFIKWTIESKFSLK